MFCAAASTNVIFFIMSEKWVDWFFKLSIGKYFVRIDNDYLNDSFNIYGMREKIERNGFDFKTILKLVRGEYTHGIPHELNECAIQLYGLIHARYLMTKNGTELLLKNYLSGVYGKCPNFNCQFKCLPYGIDSDPGNSCLLMYCPKCHDVYYSNHVDCMHIDGSAFYSSYLVPFEHEYPIIRGLELPPKPQLKLFGFKIEEESLYPYSSE